MYVYIYIYYIIDIILYIVYILYYILYYSSRTHSIITLGDHSGRHLGGRVGRRLARPQLTPRRALLLVPLRPTRFSNAISKPILYDIYYIIADGAGCLRARALPSGLLATDYCCGIDLVVT